MQALGASDKHKAATVLLDQLLRPSVADFAAFAKSNAAYLASLGVAPDAAVETVKLLSLNDALAAAVESRSGVSYADIAAHLGVRAAALTTMLAPQADVNAPLSTYVQVDVDAVGGYVIRGVDAGLFEAQLDEVEQAVFPRYAHSFPAFQLSPS